MALQMADDSDRDDSIFYEHIAARNRKRPPTRVEIDALNRVRNAVAFLRGKGARSATVEQEISIAVESHAAHLEIRYNRGVRFPDRPSDLPPGRRIAEVGDQIVYECSKCAADWPVNAQACPICGSTTST